MGAPPPQKKRAVRQLCYQHNDEINNQSLNTCIILVGGRSDLFNSGGGGGRDIFKIQGGVG